MKILFIIPSYEPAWGFGGTVTATVNLCTQLSKDGHDVTVYTTNADADGSYLPIEPNCEHIRNGVKVCYFECNVMPKRAFYSSKLIAQLENTIQHFDIVNMSAIWQFLGYAAYKICKKYNIPYIVTPHSSLMKHAFFGIGNQWIKQLYWNLFGKKVIQDATAIHYLSEGEYTESKDIAKNDRFFIVPNGIHIDDYQVDVESKNMIRSKYNISENTFLILFLGRIHSKKNIDLVMKSLPMLKEQSVDFKFLIVGNTEEEWYLDNLKEIEKDLKLESDILWIGKIENAEVKYYYASSDVMVLPSKLEGVSMALTESMVQGLPLLISNRVANYKEIEIDQCGIVVEPNFESTKQALLKLSTNVLFCKELGNNAISSVNKRYAIEAVAKAMVENYKSLVERG
jgi:glycosyltransferase involved in cell wall biosynthesis